MIHQYQCEILDEDANHGPVFRAWARGLQDETGYDIY